MMTRHHLATALAAAMTFAASALPAQEDSAPPLPPPGRLIDVGGWRLHLNCTGTAVAGQPTVVLEAGVGDFSVEWSLVQPAVAKFARVCSYDRAGDGWSDAGPFPRTFRQIVSELHTLLERSGERAPFLLVGHSYGGGIVRQYTTTYPNEVAGLVLVEAGADDPWRLTANGQEVRSSSLATNRQVPPVKTTPLTQADIPASAMAQITRGLADNAANANEAPRDLLPSDAQRMRAWALGRWQHVVAAVNPFENEELLALSKDRMSREYPLGDLPLVVLTRGVPEDDGTSGKKHQAEHRSEHEAVARMSRKGKLIVAERSGHHVQLQQPELVVDAIRDVIRDRF